MRLLLIICILFTLYSCREEFKPLEIESVDHGIAFLTVEQLSDQGILVSDELHPLFFTENPNQPFTSQPIYEEGQIKGFLVKVDSIRSMTVELVPTTNFPTFDTLTNIRFAKKKPTLHEVNSLERLPGFDTNKTSPELQMEGPAWENEKVAFRNYFDQRNGIDIFGKRVDTLVLDQVGLPWMTSYHELTGWGQDILKVGNSLGAGAIALQIGDSLYRIAPEANAAARIKYEGPLRSEVEFTFNDWKIAGRTYQVIHTMGIQSGTRYYDSSVKVKGLQGDENLVSGIVNMESDSLYSFEGKGELAFGTFDRQAFGGEELGMAIALKKADFVTTFQAPHKDSDIVDTYCIRMRLYQDHPTQFKFYSCWVYEDDRFSDLEGFTDFIQSDLK